MTSSLRKQIWEAHPHMPRVQKLKLVKYIPLAYKRILLVSKHLELPEPEQADPVKCSIDENVLTLRSSSSALLGQFDLGKQPRTAYRLLLPSGHVFTEHEFHQLIQSGECQCPDCQRQKLEQQQHDEDSRMDFYAARYLQIHVPKEQKINAPSPELSRRLGLDASAPDTPVTKVMHNESDL